MTDQFIPNATFQSECCDAMSSAEISLEHGVAAGRCSACGDNAVFYAIDEDCPECGSITEDEKCTNKARH